MTEIFQAKNPKILPIIAEKLSEFEDLDIEQALEIYLLQLASKPDDTCIITVFDDEELKCFIFGWANHEESYGWIQQAWGEPELKPEYKTEAFDKFCDWSLSKGLSEVRAQTQRTNMKAWERLYGLTEYAVVMSKEL